MEESNTPQLRSVLLRHETPPGGGLPTHHDWLIETAPGIDPDERALAAFRLVDGVDPMTTERFEGIEIGAHRRRYLSHEGPIGGGRGSVRRLWRVHAGVTGSLGSGSIRVSLIGPEGTVTIAGERGEGPAWLFTRV